MPAEAGHAALEAVALVDFRGLLLRGRGNAGFEFSRPFLTISLFSTEGVGVCSGGRVGQSDVFGGDTVDG